METRSDKETRMMKLLSDIWNKDEPDVELLLQYDPLVRMLFRTTLYSYEEVSEAVKSYQKELLRDTAGRLLPDYYFNAIPAHNILQAQPPAGSFFLKAFRNFSCQHQTRESTTEAGFINIADTLLIKGDLRVMGAYNGYYNITDKKEFVGIGEPRSAENENVFYLGIKANPDTLKTMNHLVVYLGYDPSHFTKKWIFNTIANGKWSINNQVCRVSEGLPENSIPGQYAFYKPKEGQIAYYAGYVKNLYKKNFITIHLPECCDEASAENVPGFIPRETLDSYKDIRIWISVKASMGIDIENLSNAFDVRINAFPSMNCKLLSDRLTRNESIKEIETGQGEFFLCMNNVGEDDAGFGLATSADELVISGSRYKSFDQHDLNEMLDTLIRVYDNEISIADKKDTIIRENLDLLRKLSDIVHDLKKQAKARENGQMRLHIRSRANVEDYINYQYYTTLGHAANDIPEKQKFSFDGIGLKDKSALSITRSAGGRKPCIQESVIPAMRLIMLSRDRIVTREDVRNLCYYLFGEASIQKVTIDNKVKPGRGKVGLHRVIVTTITLKKNCPHSPEQIKALKNELIAVLHSKSLNLMEMDFDVVVS